MRDDYFTLWRSLEPTIAKVQGFAIAGDSDIAPSCDLVVMAEDARIGYMPARVWGCATTAMSVYRLGAERAKRTSGIGLGGNPQVIEPSGQPATII